MSKKAAVLIGINYKGTENQLNGCENDINDMKSILIRRFGFKPENVLVLMECLGGEKIPTRENILNAMNWIVEKNKQGYDDIWFQYSGHGTHIEDRSGDEADGQDEAMVTSDLKLVVDDEIYSNLIKPLPSSCNLVAIMDCCHSGSILDLRYKYCGGSYNSNDNVRCKTTANIIALSGCMDNQTSADAVFQKRWNGALTKNLIKLFHMSNFKLTCNSLMINLINNLKRGGFTQFPQMTCSRPLNANIMFCNLGYKGKHESRPYLC